MQGEPARQGRITWRIKALTSYLYYQVSKLSWLWIVKIMKKSTILGYELVKQLSNS